jgi:hypothetical protein
MPSPEMGRNAVTALLRGDDVLDTAARGAA